MGNVIKLPNGHIIICTGYHPNPGPDIIEADKNGHQVFTMTFNGGIYKYTSYRVYEYQDIIK